MRSEKLKILRMVADQQLGTEEALDLLEAMDLWDERGPRPRWLRVRVTKQGERHPRVDIGVPVAFVLQALRAGLAFADLWPAKAPRANFDEVKHAYDAGQSGLVVDTVDPDTHQHIELTLE